MVLRCAWGTCNGDSRYPEKMQGGYIVRFPTIKRDVEKCKRWIRACGRPHEQLNLNRLDRKNKGICSKHFVGGFGPTVEYPDPISALDSKCTPARKLPVKRAQLAEGKPSKRKCLQELQDENRVAEPAETTVTDLIDIPTGVPTQTEGFWTSELDLLALAAEKSRLQTELEKARSGLEALKKENEEKEKLKDKEISDLNKQLCEQKTFGVQEVLIAEQKNEGLLKYYTGIEYTSFLNLYRFVTADGESGLNISGRSDIKRLSPADCYFLTMCRLRHGFGLQDLAMRFNLSVQSAGVVFNKWLDLLYCKLGSVSIWPHRDTIIKEMPDEYRKKFPTTLIIIDGTELRTQVPSALALQSQMYSDYKSSTTLKGVIGCDPRGTVMFVSQLFTGSISDKAITQDCGFYETIKSLKEIGYVKDGDAIMVDKGFNIHKEMKGLNVGVNIPPYARAGMQMSESDNTDTTTIGQHRVHVERVIGKVKTFQLVSQRVPTTLFPTINKIWTVCCLLTMFQDTFVKDKEKQLL